MHILHGIPKNCKFLKDHTQNLNNRLLTKKLIKVENKSDRIYKTDRQVRFYTLILRSELHYFSDGYDFVKGTIIVNGNMNAAGFNRKLPIKIVNHLLVALEKYILSI